MKKDAHYLNFVKKWEEVIEIPPQALGPLTPYYKLITKHLKVRPFSFLLLLSVLLVFMLYLLFGSFITTITSILQRGF